MALVSARPRNGPRYCQSAGLHAHSDAERSPGLDHARGHRQAQHADPAAERDHETHHHQSDLERAAIDRAQRISAGTGAGSTVLRRMGLQVHYGADGVSITQPPGDRNALGRVRFNFPNRFLVYQHDTPDKYMFAHDVRAESHGCMRVQDPAKYAEVLLNIARPDEHWTAEKVKSMFGAAEQDVQLQPAPIWVHLTYQSAFVDEAGKLQMRRDVYNLDARTLVAIKHERGTIDSDRRREPEVASYSPYRASAASRSARFYQPFFASAPPFLRPPRGLSRAYYR